jgi:hypothetical protein
LRRIDLQGNDIGYDGARLVAASSAFPSLESLDLRSNRLGPAGVASLARSPLAARLRELWLGEEKGSDDHARAFAAGEWPALRNLVLDWGRLGADGAAALASCPSLAGVRALELLHNYQPLAALFRSPHLAAVERLFLRMPVSPSDLEALAESPMLASLRGLILFNGNDGISQVLASPASAGLAELDFHANSGIDLMRFGRSFREAGHLGNLRRVTFVTYSSNSEWVLDFVQAPHLAGVIDLDLPVFFDYPAIRALIDSPHLGGLRRLVLRYHPVVLNMRTALDERFGSALRIK